MIQKDRFSTFCDAVDGPSSWLLLRDQKLTMILETMSEKLTRTMFATKKRATNTTKTTFIMTIQVRKIQLNMWMCLMLKKYDYY